MPRWCCLYWRVSDPAAAEGAADLSARFKADGWTLHIETRGWTLWTRGSPPAVQILEGERGAVLGELHPHPAHGAQPGHVVKVLPFDPEVASRLLTERTWGRYVALLGMDGDRAALYRDPSGAFEAFVWDVARGVTVASDEVWGLPAGLAPPRLSIDWSRVALGLIEPVAAIVEPPLRGFDPVGAGMLKPLQQGAAQTSIWRPSMFATDAGLGPAEAADAIRARTERCVSALLDKRSAFLAEVSGGLDSAIVASTAVLCGHAPSAAAWINTWSPLGGADERAYAHAVAARLGIVLRELKLEPAVFSDQDHAGILDGVRPPLTAASREYDRTIAAVATQVGADALLTGEGGDAVFFQSPTPLIAADLLALRGPQALLSEEMAQHARRLRRSLWTLAANACATRHRRRPALSAPPRPCPARVRL